MNPFFKDRLVTYHYDGCSHRAIDATTNMGTRWFSSRKEMLKTYDSVSKVDYPILSSEHIAYLYNGKFLTPKQAKHLHPEYFI